MLKSLTRLLGGSNEGVIKRLQKIVDEINALEPDYERLSDDQLRAKTDEFRKLHQQGESLDDILPDAYAAVREASKRTLGMRHFDVQMIGGIALHEGKIAEMKTGEGKTLVATLPTYLNALTGQGVHVVTVNDYLARRDAQWMGRIYHMLGLSIGVLQHDSSYMYDPDSPTEGSTLGMERLRKCERRDVYRADITYGTNNEFGFDYLRDNMVADTSRKAQRALGYAIVDEVDNILIDEARTPLIISGPGETPPNEYYRFARIVPQLQQEEDYTIDEKHKTAALTPDGMSKLERLLGVSNLYDPSNFALVHFAENALKAHAIYLRDQDYVVKDGEVVIVDEFTGRLMTGRRFSDGLHQALEAKEGVKVQRETVTYATITLQNYFRLYKKLAGMTGTAATEAEEFFKIYKLEVVEIPTNKPMVRKDSSDLIFKNEKAKFRAVVSEIEERHKKGQPVLVGTTDIDKSEALSEMLKRKGIPHEVLNAKQHEREALIVAQAGRPGAVTVATNMAGRGTDIILGGSSDGSGMSRTQWEADHNKVVELGGLHIVGTERHEARRIDNQLRGRSGRQGDPGSSQFYVALDDEIMRRFGGDRIRAIMDWAGYDDDTPIQNRMISKSIEGAQTKVEAYHFEIRKHLVEYDDVVNTHRDIIYRERDKILGGADLKSNIQAIVERELIEILDEYVPDSERGVNWDTEALLKELSAILPPIPDLSDPEAIRETPKEQVEERVLQHARDTYEDFEGQLGAEVMRAIERQVMLRVIDSHWVQHLTAMENLRQGIGLHAFGQRDPLVMYKKEGHEAFQNLQTRMQRDIAYMIYHAAYSQINAMNGVTPTNRQQRRATASNGQPSTAVSKVAEQARAREGAATGGRGKIGRNDPCYCGSGKKYKRCHGAAA